MSDDWQDWLFNVDTAERSMYDLARYTNPAQTVRQGLGLGRSGLINGQDPMAQAEVLAHSLVEQRVRYTIEPFRRDKSRQIIRTTQELLDGSGTCVDFAITMAALCNRENIPVTLALALPHKSTRAHAFVLAHNDDPRRPRPYLEESFGYWLKLLNKADSPYRLLDTTPLKDGGPGDLAARNRVSLGILEGYGQVFAIEVRAALRRKKTDYYTPPARSRNLGITAYLPDPPRDMVHFKSQEDTELGLSSETGRIVLVGESGTGKSTLALHRATSVSEQRGWFLDASDRDTLIRSLAAAEAQSRGAETGPVEAANLGTLAYRAQQRLARSERPWVVVMDNANDPEAVAELFPTPRPANDPGRAADILIVTTTKASWASSAEEKGWRRFSLKHLDDRDAARAGGEAVWNLLNKPERLPGLVRIATKCAPELLAGQDDPPGARRLARTALGVKLDQDKWPSSTVLTTVAAVSFMPAEQITVRWLARAVFGGSDACAAAGLKEAEDVGLIEHSRSGELPDSPLWMHRLVRTAVRELTAGITDEIGVRVLASYDRTERYSSEETTELHDFVRGLRSGCTTTDDFLAATTVIDLLETRGSAAGRQAGRLAETYVDEVEPALGLSTSEGLTVWAKAQLAIARPANQDPRATADEIAEGLRRAAETADRCTQVIDVWSGEWVDLEDLVLLRGRAQAMRGNLLKKHAMLMEKAGDKRAEATFRAAIEVLTDSYTTRRAVFKVETDGVISLKPDPDQHVDRGWYNLGGANIALANLLYRTNPIEDGRAVVAKTLSEAMVAYAGSLSLRRSAEISKYTAASLWGVGLCAYSAALYCPGKLDLSMVEPTLELNSVRQVQNRNNLLHAAEDCVAKALNIWAEIDGVVGNDTKKARNLLRKIAMAWDVDNTNAETRSTQFWRTIRPAATDLGIQFATQVVINTAGLD